MYLGLASNLAVAMSIAEAGRDRRRSAVPLPRGDDQSSRISTIYQSRRSAVPLPREMISHLRSPPFTSRQPLERASTGRHAARLSPGTVISTVLRGSPSDSSTFGKRGHQQYSYPTTGMSDNYTALARHNIHIHTAPGWKTTSKPQG